jgi:hypothetical protein
VALLAILAACKGELAPEALTLQVSPPTLSIRQRESARVVAAVHRGLGGPSLDVPISFSSSNPAVVAVSAEGLVTSLGPVDTASIEVRAAGATTRVHVTVERVTARIVAPDTIFLAQLDSAVLDARVLDVAGGPVPGANVTFISPDPTVATVNAAGVVKSMGPARRAVVIVGFQGLTRLVVVAIRQVPRTLTFNRPGLRLPSGRSYRLRPQVLDAADSVIAGQPIQLTNSVPQLVTLGPDGVVTAGALSGTGSIEAASGAVRAVLAVEVVPVTSPAGYDTSLVNLGDLTPIDVALTTTGIAYVTASRPFVGWYRYFVLRMGPDLSRVQRAVDGVVPSMTAWGLSFNDAGTRAYVLDLTYPGSILTIDVANDQVMKVFAFPESWTADQLTVTRDGSFAFSVTSVGLVKVDLATESILDSLKPAPPRVFTDATFNHSQSRLYATAESFGQFLPTEVAEIDAASFRVLRTFTPSQDTCGGLVTSRDGRSLYMVCGTQLLEVGLANLSITGLTIGPCEVQESLPSPDDREVVIGCGDRLIFYDRIARKVRRELRLAGIRQMAISADGFQLAVTTPDGLVIVR